MTEEHCLYAHVGSEVIPTIAVTSTLGIGPTGATGAQGIQGIQGVQGEVGPEGGTPVVVVAAVSWPPAAPTAGTLYLKGA